MTAPNRANSPLSRNVKALGIVSLFADIASEMIYPLLPLFLTTVVGASGTAIGTIEGLADSTSSFLKLLSGWWADRVRRKPLVVFGYVLSALARPLIGLATASWQVLGVRLGDRTGKGIRTSPRDALLADSSAPEQRGRAFGFHRALDNIGAVLGPLLAWVMFNVMGVGMRSIFLWSALPGVISVIILVLVVRERKTSEPRISAETARVSKTGDLGGVFWRYLAVVFVFTLGASSDAFLLLRVQQMGVPVAQIPILYAANNLVRVLSATPGGTLSDRFGRKPLILAGWTLYALVYLGFAFAESLWAGVALFLVYGLFYGLTEGSEKAFVADLVPSERRGTAYGWFNFAIGLGALPASVLFGLVWDRGGPIAAFAMGAIFAAVAALGLLGQPVRAKR